MIVVTSFVMCAAILGWFFFAWFVVYCFVEQHLPNFVFMFTRVSRLERQRDRLKRRISDMKDLKGYREQIKELEKSLGAEVFTKPQEFLDTE